MKNRWLLFAVFVLSLATLTSTNAFAATAADRGARAEVRFLEGMIDHHQMALDMANDCTSKAKTDSVVTLCKAIITAQSAEIKEMQSWLASWYQIQYNPMPMSQMMDMLGKSKNGNMMGGMNMGTPDAMGMNGMNMGSAMPDDMPGMMGMMAGLSKLEGKDYEVAWVEAMIDHHAMAVVMSQQLLPYVEHPELKKLAQNIIDDQTAQIKQMEDMLTQFGDK